MWGQLWPCGCNVGQLEFRETQNGSEGSRGLRIGAKCITGSAGNDWFGFVVQQSILDVHFHDMI